MGWRLEDAETSAWAQSNPRRLFNSFCAWLEWREELAGGEVIEGAEAATQVDSAQAALPIQPAHMLLGRALPFLRVAIQTARHQVSMGILSQLRSRHDVVEAPPVLSDPPRTIEAAPALIACELAGEGHATRRLARIRVCPPGRIAGFTGWCGLCFENRMYGLRRA
jgi:hypothetical protein